MYKGAINSLSYTNGFNGIILIIYCIFVFSTYSIVTYSDSWISLLFAVIFFSLFSFFACPFILKKASGISITPKDFKSTYLSEGCLKFILYAIPLLVLFIHFSAYYPGGFSVDSVNQYEQAYSDTYNDWQWCRNNR